MKTVVSSSRKPGGGAGVFGEWLDVKDRWQERVKYDWGMVSDYVTLIREGHILFEWNIYECAHIASLMA